MCKHATQTVKLGVFYVILPERLSFLDYLIIAFYAVFAKLMVDERYCSIVR